MSASTEVQALLTAIGDAAVVAVYDARLGVTSSAGNMTSWDDARVSLGTGTPGPQMTVGGGTPTYDGTNFLVQTNGTTGYMQTAADAKFALGGSAGKCIVYIGTTGTGNAVYTVGVSDSPTAPTRWFGIRTATAAPRITAQTNIGGSLATTGGAVSTPDTTTRRLIVASLPKANTPTPGGGVTSNYAYRLTTGGRLAEENIVASLPATGNNIATLGRIGSQFQATKCRAIVILDREPTAADMEAIRVYADAHTVTYDLAPAVIFIGNSLTRGQNATTPGTVASTGTSYPAYTMKALQPDGATAWSLGALTGYDAINLGVSSITGATILQDYSERVAAQVDPRRTRNFVCVWEGTNDIFTAALTSAQTLADLKAMADQVVAAGGTPLMVDVMARGNFSAGQNTTKAAVNAALVDPTDLTYYWPLHSRALARVSQATNLTNPSDTTYFAADTVHLTDLGYGEVAKLVQPQLKELESIVAGAVTAGTPDATSVPLSWAAPTNSAVTPSSYSYVVQYGVGSNPSTWTTFATNVAGTSSTVTGLTTDQLYAFRVIQVSSNLVAVPTAAVTATPTAPTTPPPSAHRRSWLPSMAIGAAVSARRSPPRGR